MSNHYHLVLHVDRGRSAAWTHQEVVERWARLFRLPSLIDEWQKGCGGDAVRVGAEALIERYRERLSDVSRYMACMNEYLARRANAEDQCTGRFWEGRFKCQALLDEAGLLTAMTYVDLNPVRAGVLLFQRRRNSLLSSLASSSSSSRDQHSRLKSLAASRKTLVHRCFPFAISRLLALSCLSVSSSTSISLTGLVAQSVPIGGERSMNTRPRFLNGSASTLMHGGQRCDLRAMFSVGVLVE